MENVYIVTLHRPNEAAQSGKKEAAQSGTKKRSQCSFFGPILTLHLVFFSVSLSFAPFLIMHLMNANANMQANVDEYLASHENVRLRLRMNGNREEKKNHHTQKQRNGKSVVNLCESALTWYILKFTACYSIVL